MFERFKAEKRLSVAEEAIEKLERSHKALRLEWEDAYERLTRVVQRITKRAQVVENAERESQEEAEPLEGDDTTGLLHLTPHQRTMQAKILAQRGRRNNGVLPG